MKHTPEEWLKKYEELTPQGSEFANDPENVFLYIGDRLHNEGHYAKANVRLKRTNAELLEALKETVKFLNDGDNTTEYMRPYQFKAWKKGKQTIAKAEEV